MAVLTASRTMQYKERTDPRGDVVELPMIAADIIYSGSFVGMVAAGHVQPMLGTTVGTTLTGFDRILGIALEEVDNSAGAAAAKTVKVLVSGCFYTAISGLALTDQGAPVFASDESVVTLSALGNPFLGWVERYEASGYGWVRLAGPESRGGYKEISRMSKSIETVAANKFLMIHPSENRTGLVVIEAWAMISEVMGGDSEDQGIITLEDTAGGDITTFTPSDAAADAEHDIVPSAANKCPYNGALGSVIAVVAADAGVQCLVSQLTSGASEAGAMKVYCRAILNV